MPFTEELKAEAKRRAHFHCCVCREVGPLEIHHIVSQAEGGPDTADNAAPLCPSCHELLGANPTKRKFIREARDLWYDVCVRKYEPEGAQFRQVLELLQAVPTRADLERAIEQLAGTRTARPPGDHPEAQASEFLDSPLNPETLRTYLRWAYPDVAHCGPAQTTSLTQDLLTAGHRSLRTVHAVLGDTREAFADFARSRRDRGQNIDMLQDNFPATLFLALLDEPYCRLTYPESHAKDAGHRRWLRRIYTSNPATP